MSGAKLSELVQQEINQYAKDSGSDTERVGQDLTAFYEEIGPKLDVIATAVSPENAQDALESYLDAAKIRLVRLGEGWVYSRRTEILLIARSVVVGAIGVIV